MKPSYEGLLKEASLSFALKDKVSANDLRHYAWASGDYNPIHYNPKIAQAMGLAGPIAHGMYGMGLIQRGLTEIFLNSPYRISEWENRFVAMVPLDSALRMYVKVQSRDDQGLKLDVQVCLENGEKSTVMKSRVVMKVKE